LNKIDKFHVKYNKQISQYDAQDTQR